MTENANTTSHKAAWSGPVPVEDTALAVTDTGGPGQPVVYLNGSYATQRNWRHVIAELGDGYRHITFDERARGRSEQSADYSFAACLRDVDAVLEATGVRRPLLVGWSYGAALALHWSTRNPDRTVGAVMVDGGYPWDYLATVEGGREAGREQIRAMFRKLGWIMPLVRPLGLAARMSAEQHAEINIELNEIVADSDPVFDLVTFPMRFLVATGASLGGTEEGLTAMRATLDPILARNPHVQVSATVPSKHTTVVRKDFRAIATAVREVCEVCEVRGGGGVCQDAAQ
ncbi:alpha/beta fold hydrolase [Kitasatospora sp. CB02891]|uniref:alpha/beta fold hydrolase n=1 Tax=Kitasatospora sp. CB02891 TaxID=2020329 RepID=UPI000C26F9E0|nr:alpha/beta hydrolase [Kitasatospora sp. CB02891]PJN29174.1 alpha/beta hydrolase [Kitasatospora sp. CB02891]